MPIVKFHENTTARKGLTYSKMTKYILLCENSEKYMCEFIRQREVSKTQKNPYHYMLDWFKVTFPHYNEQAEFNADGQIIVTTADYLTETEEKIAYSPLRQRAQNRSKATSASSVPIFG